MVTIFVSVGRVPFKPSTTFEKMDVRHQRRHLESWTLSFSPSLSLPPPTHTQTTQRDEGRARVGVGDRERLTWSIT